MEGIVTLLLQYSYLVLFFGVVIEGEIFPLSAGFLVSTGQMELFTALAVTFVGTVLGDMLFFAAARRWGRRVVEKCGWFLFVRRTHIDWLEKLFERDGKKTLFVTKFIYTFGHSSIVIAGIARMKWREFLKVDIPSSVLWACLFVFLGKIFGNSFWLVAGTFRNIGLAILAAVGTLIVVQILLRRRFMRSVH